MVKENKIVWLQNNGIVEIGLNSGGKRVIRQSCFETNSSSQHCIVVTKNDSYLQPEDFENSENLYLWKKDGSWHLYSDEVSEGFSRWPFRILTSFKDKFVYALCEFCGYYYEDEDEFTANYNMMVELAKEIVPGFQKLSICTKDIDLYMDSDGNNLPYRDLKYDGWDNENKRDMYYYLDKNGNKKPAIFDEENYLEVPAIGMIDHQSAGLLKNFLKDKGISLKEFLTNRKYAVVIDGDEYAEFSHLINSGFINMDFIREIYGTSGEDVEYAEWLKEQEEQNEGNNS